MYVGVLWSCHRFGSTYEVDLPDVLLLNGQILRSVPFDSDYSGDLSDGELVEVSYMDPCWVSWVGRLEAFVFLIIRWYSSALRPKII